MIDRIRGRGRHVGCPPCLCYEEKLEAALYRLRNSFMRTFVQLHCRRRCLWGGVESVVLSQGGSHFVQASCCSCICRASRWRITRVVAVLFGRAHLGRP